MKDPMFDICTHCFKHVKTSDIMVGLDNSCLCGPDRSRSILGQDFPERSSIHITPKQNDDENAKVMNVVGNVPNQGSIHAGSDLSKLEDRRSSFVPVLTIETNSIPVTISET